MKIMEVPKQMEILKEVAEKQGMLHYITFFEKYKEIVELASNVSNTIQQQVVRREVRNLAKNQLHANSQAKVLISAENLEGLAEKIQECGLETLGNKIDISFLKPITREVLTMLVINTLPLYKKAVDNKNNESLKNSNPTLTPSRSFSSLSGLGGLGSLLNLQHLPALPAAPSSHQPRSGSVVTLGHSENLEHLIHVLESKEVDLLKKILEKQHCMENLHYYERQKLVKDQITTPTRHIGSFMALTSKSLLNATEKKTSQSLQAVKEMIISIAKDFILEGSPQELNISAKVRYEFEEKLKTEKISVAILEPVTKEVLNNLLRNSFPVYKKLKARDKNITETVPELPYE